MSLGIAQKGSKFAIVAAIAAVAIGIAVLSTGASLTTEAFLITLLGLVLAYGILARLLQGRFDIFEPLTIFIVAWAILFVIRPTAMLISNNLEVSTYQIGEGMPGMLLMALVGAVGFLTAYSLPAGRSFGQRIRPLPGIRSAGTAVFYALTIAVLGVLSFAAFIQLSGGLPTLLALMSGRQENAAALHGISTTAYLNGALALTLPASLLLFAVAAKRRSVSLGLVGVIVALLGLTVSGPSGIRGWILPYVSAPFILLYLSRNKRPGVLLVLVLLLLGISANGFIAEARNTTTRQASGLGQLLSDNFTHFTDTWSRFILGGDTEMPNLLALEVLKVPTNIPFQNGGATAEVFVQPIPRQFWTSKPRSGDEILTQVLFVQPNINYAPRQYTPMANFYLDFGYVGVLVGMGLLGLLGRVFFEYLRANPGNPSVHLLYAAALPFIVPLLRGSIGDAAGRLVFIVPPLLLGIYLARRRASEESVPLWSSGRATVREVFEPQAQEGGA
jgi:oligosaccharide repeat unit polymerase